MTTAECAAWVRALVAERAKDQSLSAAERSALMDQRDEVLRLLQVQSTTPTSCIVSFTGLSSAQAAVVIAAAQKEGI